METVYSQYNNSPLLGPGSSCGFTSPRLGSVCYSYDGSVRSFNNQDFLLEGICPLQLNSSTKEVQSVKEDFLDLLLGDTRPSNLKVFNPKRDESPKLKNNSKRTYRKRAKRNNRKSPAQEEESDDQGTGSTKGKSRPKHKKNPKQKADYRRNICGYITRRVIREFISEAYESIVRGMCRAANVPYEKVKLTYLGLIESVTGPRHLPQLLEGANPEEQAVKKVFREFFAWFLKERYVRYLLSDGKMVNKRAYVEYKNQILAKYLEAPTND